MPHKIYDCCDRNSCSCGQYDREGYDRMFKTSKFKPVKPNFEEEMSEEVKTFTTAKYKPKYELGEVVQFNAVDVGEQGLGRIKTIQAHLNEDGIPYYEYGLENVDLLVDESFITGVFELKDVR